MYVYTLLPVHSHMKVLALCTSIHYDKTIQMSVGLA